jgi:hypothetical protein
MRDIDNPRTWADQENHSLHLTNKRVLRPKIREQTDQGLHNISPWLDLQAHLAGVF